MRGVAVPQWEPVDCHRSTFEFLQGSVSITTPRIKTGRRRLPSFFHAKGAQCVMAKETSNCGVPAFRDVFRWIDAQALGLGP